MLQNLSLATLAINPLPPDGGDRTERKKSAGPQLDSPRKYLTRQLSTGDLPSVLFAQNFAKYLKTGQFSDFTIKLKLSGQEFRVHKVFVSHLSEYFQSLLSGAFNETQNNYVTLELASKGEEEVFPAILHYMYTGIARFKLDPAEFRRHESGCGLNRLYSDRLLMTALKKRAVKYLERMLRPCVSNDPPYIWEVPLQQLVAKIIKEAVRYRFEEGDELLQRAAGQLVRIMQMHLGTFRTELCILPPSLFSLAIKDQPQPVVESCLCEYLAEAKTMISKEDFEIIVAHLDWISLLNAPFFVDLAQYFDSKPIRNKALNVIITEFNTFKQDVNLICQLSFDTLVQVLKSDELQIDHEDEAFNFVKFLIEFNEASASVKPRKPSSDVEQVVRENIFENRNDTNDEPSVAKSLGTIIASEFNSDLLPNKLIGAKFSKWSKKQQRELWETVRWAFCLPETLTIALNTAPEDLIMKGKAYAETLLGGINFLSKTRNHRVRGSVLVGRCVYDEQIELTARQAIKLSDTPRVDYDSESSSNSGNTDDRNSNGSNPASSPMPSPHLEGTKIEIPSHGIVWWLGSTANSKIYRNPVTVGHMEVACNMGFFDSSNGAALTAKTKQFFYTNSGSGVAIVIAFNGWEIWPTHYSLTHGDKTSEHALTSWMLQGSRGNSTWQVLSEHRKNTQLHSKFARAVFPLKTKDWEIPQGSFFNRFRIVLLEPNSSGQYEISLSDIEFYGRIRGLKKNFELNNSPK